ncbi:Glycosyltransferase involved in cell wall bisynthesis [Chitinophaga sp. YR627]|uniref:glycosyltransferase n=1 Tax=Chitinophaga sp. YR627 TaxID=1881041 RepID=UPI0008E5347D|nr:glycosyltransferase [Chitinophaga sp. YR627]SFN91989.1 Glycosyltransferase involved in cell wall bisynthesis [Chitinophaga sp. YR627]
MNVKKKIVHILPNLSKGGAERFTVDLCNALSADREAEVHLVSLYKNQSGSTFRDDIANGVTYHELDKKNGFDFAIIGQLYKLLRKIRPDVVHTHLNGFEYALPYKLVSGRTRFVHTLHSDAFKECDISFFRKARRVAYRLRLVQPVTISRESAESFNACYGLKNDVLIENGRKAAEKTSQYDQIIAQYKGVEKGTLLVCVGRITKEKNQELLIDAVNNLAAKGLFSGKLLIIGAVQDEQVYAKLQQKASDCVEFVGMKSNVADYLFAADAFCMSSIYEGMPLSIIEAFSVGCVPVSTAVGGINDMITHGVTGFLSRDMSVAAYEEALLACLQSENLPGIREACKNEFIQKYRIEVCAAKYSALYGK